MVFRHKVLLLCHRALKASDSPSLSPHKPVLTSSAVGCFSALRSIFLMSSQGPTEPTSKSLILQNLTTGSSLGRVLFLILLDALSKN